MKNTENKTVPFKFIFLMASCLLLSPLTQAKDQANPSSSIESTISPVDNTPDVSPDILVSKATDALLQEINNASTKDKALGLEFYEHLVEKTVGPFVDFETIAYRVMGRDVYDTANENQRKAFVQAFKQSLITTYAKGISTYDNQTIKVSPYQGIKENNGVARAKVELQIKPKNGKPFPIIYSMFQDESRGWMLENMHLDGVNVGSTFRNQFKQAHKEAKGNLDAVIKSWGNHS